jgi:hypothetical protein
MLPDPVMTSPLSRTRIGTARWPLIFSISARSRARFGSVQNFSAPPLTCFISYAWPASSSPFAALAHGCPSAASDLPSVQV